MKRLIPILCCLVLTQCAPPHASSMNQYQAAINQYIASTNAPYKRLVIGHHDIKQPNHFYIDDKNGIRSAQHVSLDLSDLNALQQLNHSPLKQYFNEIHFQGKGHGLLALSDTSKTVYQPINKAKHMGHNLYADPVYQKTRLLLKQYVAFLKSGGQLIYESERFSDPKSLVDAIYQPIYTAFSTIHEPRLSTASLTTFPNPMELSITEKMDKIFQFHRYLANDLDQSLTHIQVSIKNEPTASPNKGQTYYFSLNAKHAYPLG